jgi:hypothetical protein
MPTIPSDMTTPTSETTKKVMGNCAIIKIDGTTFALIENWSYDEGYKEEIEYVPGTPTPVIGVSGFLGEFEGDIIYSTDYMTPATIFGYSSGDLTKHPIVIEETDTTPVTPTKKTHTLSNVRFFRHANLVRKGSMVRERLRGVYATQAVVT